MQLTAAGQVAAIVPFMSREKRMLTLYKGDAALAARRDIASKLTHSLIAALKRPRRVDKRLVDITLPFGDRARCMPRLQSREVVIHIHTFSFT
jgi:hypothetical protein